jgi:hypothetical protein
VWTKETEREQHERKRRGKQKSYKVQLGRRKKTNDGEQVMTRDIHIHDHAPHLAPQ